MAKKRTIEKDAYDLCIEALECGNVAEAEFQAKKIQLHAMRRIADDQIGAVRAISEALNTGAFNRVPEYFAPLADPLRKIMQEKLRAAMVSAQQPALPPETNGDNSSTAIPEQLTEEVA